MNKISTIAASTLQKEPSTGKEVRNPMNKISKIAASQLSTPMQNSFLLMIPVQG